jgi:hypothetical protein
VLVVRVEHVPDVDHDHGQRVDRYLVEGGGVNAEQCACGAAAVRLIAAVACCSTCAHRILEPLRDRHLVDEGGIGWGRQNGPLRPDWGADWAELECTICSATWTGPIGEPCGYCQRTHELLVDAHRRVLLWPDAEMLATEAKRADWGRRLAWAVQEDIVTEHEARAALAREARRDAA